MMTTPSTPRTSRQQNRGQSSIGRRGASSRSSSRSRSRSSSKGVAYRGHARDTVNKVREYFEFERANGGPILAVDQVIQRTIEATGVSRASVYIFQREKDFLQSANPHSLPDSCTLLSTPGRLKGNGLSELVGGNKLISPFFDPYTPLNVSAQIGKSAYLTCIVHNVGNMSVSWVRHRDIHILTVGAYTYTSDQRFMSLHKRETNEWTLQIKWVQKRDAGMYECQVSSIPVMSLFVHLAVVVPCAVIHGTSDVHIEYGSTINLTCSINYATESPAYIFWYHHDKSGKVAVVNYDSDRGGISVITIKAEVSTSHLVIRGAREADAGKYYCSPSNADVAYVHVHVHSSKSPSAIQTSVGTLGNSYLLMVLAMVLITVST